MSFHFKICRFYNGNAINYKRVIEEREEVKEKLQWCSYIGAVGSALLGLTFFPLPPLVRTLVFFPGFMAF